MKLIKRATIALGLMAVGSPLLAIPLPPEPLSVPVYGESNLGSFPSPTGDPDIQIDWMVIPSQGGLSGTYAYLYQIEAPADSITHVDAFSITFDTTNPGAVIDAGFLTGDDLDVATAFHGTHNLLGETEQTFAATSPNDPPSISNDGITWTFPAGEEIEKGFQSVTLYFTSKLPPTYGNAVAQNSTPPSPWGSLALKGQAVPVPRVPDGGGTVVLLGLGLLGLEGLRRRCSV